MVFYTFIEELYTFIVTLFALFCCLLYFSLGQIRRKVRQCFVSRVASCSFFSFRSYVSGWEMRLPDYNSLVTLKKFIRKFNLFVGRCFSLFPFFLNWTTWPDFKMFEDGASENNPIINDSLDTEDLYCCYPNFVSIHVIFSQFFQISVDHRKITNTLHYFVSPRDPVGEIQLNAQWFSVFHVKWKTLLSKLRWLTSI